MEILLADLPKVAE